MAKEKFTLEYNIRSVPPILLWPFLSTPGGLEQWFADSVERQDKTFIFSWNKVPTNASLVSIRPGSMIRFRWEEDKQSKERAFFEFKILVSELTDDTTLVVTDFAEPDEKDSSVDLWDSQIENLKTIIGCR